MALGRLFNLLCPTNGISNLYYRRVSIRFCSLKTFVYDEQKQKPNIRLFNRLKELGPRPDWRSVKESLPLKFFKQDETFFEISIMSNLVILFAEEEKNPDQVKQQCESFLEFIQSKKSQKPLYLIHYACILSIIDVPKHEKTIMEIVMSIITNQETKHFAKYLPFSITLYNVARSSPENSKKIFELVLDNEDLLSRDIMRRLRIISIDHGLTESLTVKTKKMTASQKEVTEWVNVYSKESKMANLSEKEVFNFLKSMDLHNLYFYSSHEKAVLQIFAHLGYTHKKVTINGTKCPHCSKSLYTFSQDEMIRMKEGFIEKVIKRHSWYENTTPGEFNSFMNSITSKEYGIVVDILNAAGISKMKVFATQDDDDKYPANIGPRIVRVRDDANQRKMVKALLLKLIRDLPPVFSISRSFVSYWSDLHKFSKQNSDKLDIFRLNFMSHDDMFLILAALGSPKTFILTNDYFRDHVFKMDDPVFTRWISNRTLKVMPDFFLPEIFFAEVKVNLHDDSSFHLPFSPVNSLPYSRWFCVQKKVS